MHRSNSYQATTEPISPAPSPAHLYSQQQWTRTWIETTLKQPLPTTNLFLCLRTGVILCRLINILHPGIISKIYYDECISAKEQNIRQFLDAGSKLGLQDCELFKVDHLLEGKDMNAVLWTLSRLATLTGTQQQQQVSWSSYDLYSIGSSMLSTPLTPLADDNKTTSSTYEHATYHQGSHIGSNIPTEKGLDQLKEANSYHSGDLSLLLSIQQRRGSNDLQQHRTSLWSLPDEEDDIDWNHHHRPQSPRTQSFGPSSLPTTPQSTFKSIKIPSTDSGYGTAQQPTPPQSTTVPLKLVSLFDQSQQHCPITPSSTSYQTYNGSGTDDDDDDMNLQTTCDTSPSSNDSNKNGKGSISSRLSSLSSFGKKFSLRQKTPFHMRYQEWTESHMNNNSNTKPSVINLFDLPNLDTSSSLVHPSVSSPLLSKSHQQFTITDKHHSSDNNNNNRANLTIQESTSSTEPLPTDIINSSSLGETLTRRKSTSNLEGQKRSTITRTSSEIVCQQDSLELIGVDGQVTAKYKLGNVIGKGQFGIVYRALELRTGKMMAVKRIKLDSSKEGDLLDVMQEAKLLQQLSHPNIVKYEGIIQTQDHVNIILEYVENGSLLNTLKSFGSFPENLVASYCTRVLHGLQYLHGQNVAHCDLKAANLLTTKSGLVKLSDFGVSLNLGLKETEVGAVAGTPNWMAPEVIKLKGASTKSDIWSLGCTIIELCTGKPPYSDMLPMTALFRIVEDDFPPLPDGLSEELCEFLKDCFAKNPDDRPTAEELLSHAWIRTYQHEEPDMEQLDNITGEQHDLNDSINLPTQSDHTISLSLSNTPLESTHDLPSDIDTTGRPASSSVLANKFQQQQQEHYDYIRQHHSTQVVIPHCYVKGTFPKGAVKCKSCHLPIKKDAFICEECGIICHDQCKKTSGCHGSTFVTSTTPPAIHRQSSYTPSYTPEITEQLLKSPYRSISHQRNRRSESSYSLQAFLSSTSPSQYEGSIKPRNSVSTQLRQHTRKLSRVFSSRLPSSTATTNLSSPHPSHRSLTHGSKSYDTLRQIQEESYYSTSLKQAPQPPSSSSSSTYQLEYDSPLSTCSSASSSCSPLPTASTPRRESEPVDMKKRSTRRNKIKRRATNPDDCIIT